MQRLRALITVAAGSGLGATLRWAAVTIVPDTSHPWFILLLNVIGSVGLGVLLGRSIKIQTVPSYDQVYLAGGAGFCGGLTTFSTFAVQIAQGLDKGDLMASASLAAATAVLTVVGAGLGYRIGKTAAW